jgi:hypothetical protein
MRGKPKSPQADDSLIGRQALEGYLKTLQALRIPIAFTKYTCSGYPIDSTSH